MTMSPPLDRSFFNKHPHHVEAEKNSSITTSKPPVKTHPGHKKIDCYCQYRSLFKDYFMAKVTKSISWAEIWDRSDDHVKNRFDRGKFSRVFERFYQNWGFKDEETKCKHYSNWPETHFVKLLTFLEIKADFQQVIIQSFQQSKTRPKRKKKPSKAQITTPPAKKRRSTFPTKTPPRTQVTPRTTAYEDALFAQLNVPFDEDLQQLWDYRG